MSHRNWEFRLEDINEALDRIEEYTKDVSSSSWAEDRKTIDAVIRNLEIIGEAANHIPESIQLQYSKIPWPQMKGLRNILIHEYFGVDTEVLWKTVHEDLPHLKNQIQIILVQIKK